MLSMGRKSRLRVVAGTVSVAALTLGALGLTASGTQAAERLRTKVGHTIGVDIASLDAAVATAPSAPAASGTGEAQAAPAAPVPPAPPSAAAPEAAPVPPEAPAGAVPPAPPAPPAADDQRYQWTDKDGKTRVVILRKHRNGPGSDSAHDVLTDAEIAKLKADGGPMIRKRIIIRDRDGKVVTDDLKGMPDIPEVTSANCAGDGNPHQTVLHGEKGGRRTIIICTNRIDKLAAEASQMAANSKDIERRAYQSALTGLRAARDKAGVRDNAEALKGIDEAIAEIEQDLAKLD